MSADRCRLCGNFIMWSRPCECQPFQYEIEDWNEGEPQEFWSRGDAEMVAEAVVANMDRNGDYTVISGGEAKVAVTDRDGNVEKFEVHGEMEPRYIASRVYD